MQPKLFFTSNIVVIYKYLLPLYNIVSRREGTSITDVTSDFPATMVNISPALSSSIVTAVVTNATAIKLSEQLKDKGERFVDMVLKYKMYSQTTKQISITLKSMQSVET